MVLPDNVLFADGDGEKIRCDLMDKCDLHTILRLPTGIFYAQGVKTNVLFFTRGRSDKGNTKEVWFYDLRTNMPSFGKTTPLKTEHFADFEKAYEAEDRHTVQDERWSVFTREQIAEKGNSLDLGLIRDDSVLDYNDLPDPAESAEEAAANLEEAVDLLMSVVKGAAGAGGAGLMAKKKETLMPEERLQATLVPESEQPYKVPANWYWVRLKASINLYNGDRGINYPSKRLSIQWSSIYKCRELLLMGN